MKGIIKFLIDFYNSLFKSRTKVVYKDDDIIIADKEYDLKINSNNKTERTVQTFLKKTFPELASKKLVHEYYFVHRLDFATSGLMCIPLNKKTCKLVANAFFERQTKKYYMALIRGLPSQEVIDINVPIGHDITQKIIEKMCTNDKPYCINTKHARSVVIVLEHGVFDNYPTTKVLIRPVTGRRHQIRVHCNYLGHTIVGDYTYSNKKDVLPNRMFLNSIRLVLPFQEKVMDFCLPDSFLDNGHWKCIKVVNKFDINVFNKLDEYVDQN